MHISTTAHHILHVHQNYGQITFTDGYKYHMKSSIQSPHFELNHIWFIKSKYTTLPTAEILSKRQKCAGMGLNGFIS